MAIVAAHAAVWLVASHPAVAGDLPTNGTVVSGTASISQSGSELTVNQSSSKLITNWSSFDIGEGGTVTFVQPSTSSIALNRVIGGNPSLIAGNLHSNGQVFVVNPNGVLFSNTAKVDVGGLVASTLNLTDSDFLSGNYHFTGSSSGSITNKGLLSANSGGSVALIAARIENAGEINANGGAVTLGAGSDVVLDFGDPVSLQISKGALDALIENGGAIRANGGTILLTAQAAGSLGSTVINNTGVVEAQTLATGTRGEIKLLGGMETDRVVVGGTLDVSAPNGGDGGFIETSAAFLDTAPNLKVTAEAPFGVGGSWLIDPFNYTIDSTAASNIVSALNTGTNVTVTTSSSVASYGGGASGLGDITVASAITKTGGGAATLTLQADHSIYVNSAITSSSGALGIKLSAANATSATSGGVNVAANLNSNGGQILIGGASGSTSHGIGYALNIDASNPAVAIQQNVSIQSGGGSITLNGSTNASASSYSGTQAGVYVRAGATINSGGANLYMSGISTAAAKEFGFGVEGGSGTVTNFTTGTSSGNIVLDAQNTVNVNGALGLVNNGGQAQVLFSAPSVAAIMVMLNGSAQSTTFTIKPPCGSSYPNCGTMLVPGSNNSYLYANYAAVSMATKALYVFTNNGSKTYDGLTSASGLSLTTLGAPADFSTAGLTFSTSSKNAGSYDSLVNAAGNPTSFTSASTGSDYAIAYFYGTYTIGQKALTVSGANKVYDGTTSASLTATGIVSGDNVTFSATGGFSDANVGTGKTVSATGITLGGTDAANYSLSGTTISTTANITARPVNVTSNRTYDGTTSIAAGTISLGNLVSGQALTLTGTGSVTTKDVATGKTLSLGTFALGNGTGGLASNYTLVGGTDLANITQASLSVSGLSAQDKVYDGTNTATLTGTASLSGVLGADQVSVSLGSATGTFSDANAGTGKTVTATLSGLQLSGTDAGNYQLTSASALTANITQRSVNLTGSRTYDGTTSMSAGNVTLGNLVSGEALTLTGSGSLTAKDVGTYSPLSLGTFSLGNGTGGLASNYTLVGGTDLATITKANLTISGITAQNKVYDGTTSATLSGTAGLTGIIGSDQVTVSGSATGTFGTKDAANSKTVTASLSGLSLGGIEAGNYQINGLASSLSANITKADLTVSGLSAQNKVYDGTTSATFSGTAGLTGIIGSDQVTVSGSATGAFATKDAATGKTVNATLSGLSLGGTDAGNYQINGVASPLTANITQANLTISGLIAQNKVYDGTTSATLSGTAGLTGVIGSDQVTVSGSATGAFGTKDAANGKTVTATLSGLSLGGTDAGNYLINGVASPLSANITKADLTVSGLTAQNKTYDGTTSATLSGTAGLTGIIGSDQVTVSGSATGAFATKDAATGKTVNATLSSLSLGGTDAGNYQINGVASPLTANITQANLTLSGLTAQNKVYDGTTSAAISGTAGLTGVIGSDQVTVSGSATGAFGTKDAANGKTVTATLSGLSLGGTDAGNYQIYGVASPLSADITQANLTVSGLTAQNKVYDGTTSATVSGTAGLTGVIGPDQVTVSGSATGAFATKDAATGKSVNATLSGLSLGGTDAGNYQINGVASPLTANITQANLTVSGLTAQNKVYDGTTSATLSGIAGLTGIIGSDQVTVSGSATGAFATKDAATGKTVSATLSGLSLGGADVGNYQINGIASPLTANITQANLTVSGLTAQNKVYDGTTSAALSGTAGLTGIIGSDNVTVSGSATGAFVAKDAATGKTVNATLSGLSLGGTDAGNYQINGVTSPLTANITQANLTVSGLTAQNKVYDGTTSATLGGTAGLTGIIGSDQVTVIGAATGTFGTKDAGNGKTVSATLSGLSLGGADAGNYQISGLASSIAANITQANLTISGLTAQNKVYDGTTSATLGGTAGLTGVIGSDQVTVSGSASGAFTTKDAANGKTVTASLSGLSLGGTDAGNYQINGVAAPLTANITQASLTISGLTAQNKTYDGTTSATLSGTAGLTGVIGSDQVTVSGSATGAFATKDAATGRTVNATLSGLTLGGNDAGNYLINGVASPLSANITQANLTVSGLTAQNKTYDGTTAASLTGTAGLTGVIGSDQVSVSGSATAAFATKDAANGKTVTASLLGLSLGGTDAANYQINGVASPLSANITQADLTVSGLTAQNKVYDGTTSAALTGTASLTGIIGADQVSVLGSATGAFATKDAANGKVVTASLSGLSLGGIDAGNYQINGIASPLSANIIQASLTISGLTAQNKVYDGTTSVTLSGTAGLAGILGSDQVTVSGAATGSFATKDAATGKTVNVTLSGLGLGGTDAGNYQINGVALPLSANITQASLTVSGLTAQNKVYDGSTSATLSGTASLTGVLGSDQVIVSGAATGSFGTADVGTDKAVTVLLASMSLTGADSGNYVLAGSTLPLSANINAATIAGPQSNPVSVQTTPAPAANPVISNVPVANTPSTVEPGGLSYVYVSGDTSASTATSSSSPASSSSSSSSTPAAAGSGTSSDTTSSNETAPNSGGAKKRDSSATNEPAQNTNGKTDVYVIDGGIKLNDQDAGATQ